MKFGRKNPSKFIILSAHLIDGVLFFICVFLCTCWILSNTFYASTLQEKIKLLEPLWETTVWINTTIWSALWWAWLLWSNLISVTTSSTGSLYDHWNQDWIQAVLGVLEWIQSITPNSFIEEISTTHRSVFEELLWKSWPQTYLVLLQNTNEIRPNWWFFGSYGLLTLEWWYITKLEFRDSYLPGFDRPWVWIEWPSWLLNMMSTNEIHFVWANKIGFTYADGWHVQKLHELAYPDEKTRGVIFLRLDTLLEILPQLEESITRRQFINAMADKLPRDDWKKKSLYLSELEETAGNSVTQFLQQFTASRDGLPDKFVDMYLEDIPGSFHTFLKKNNITTRFDIEAVYAWDSNTSYSKTDGFVERDVLCKPMDCQWEQCEKVVFNEILEQGMLDSSHTRHCQKTYAFDVPANYRDQIDQLEEEYGVIVGEREEHILWLDPVRWNRWVIYLWDQRKIAWLTWQIDAWVIFKTPFGQAISYQVRMEWDEQSRVVRWNMERE